MNELITIKIENVSKEGKEKIKRMMTKRKESLDKMIEDYHKGKWDKYFNNL